jgi:hypothetical protein
MGEIFDDILYSHHDRDIVKIELINGALSIQLDDHPVGHRYTIRAVSPLGIARMRMSRQVVMPDESVFFLPIG